MKKYFLGLLAIPFSLIAFSNAGSITFTSNGNSYIPSTLDLPVNINELTIGDFSCDNSEECGIQFSFDNVTCLIAKWGDEFFNACSSEDYQGVVSVLNNRGTALFNTITLNYPGNSGGGNEGGDEGGNIGGGVISDGFGSLTPVIIGVKDVTFQLIPMIIYIGIGVLIAILGFYAIRWLVNWIGGKINSYFNSKRD